MDSGAGWGSPRPCWRGTPLTWTTSATGWIPTAPAAASTRRPARRPWRPRGRSGLDVLPVLSYHRFLNPTSSIGFAEPDPEATRPARGGTMSEVTQTLDVRGQSCPLPVVRASQAIKGLSTGQTLEVLATDP